MNSQEFLAQYPRTTQTTYGVVLREFSRITNKSAEYATTSEIIAYQRAIENQASATVSRKLATLHSLYRFLQECGARADDPMRAIRRPKVDRLRSIEWLTTVEIQRLLGAVQHDPRTLALVWVGLHGLRVSEIHSLNIEDMRDGALRVYGKGNKSRMVPLVLQAQLAVRNYIGHRTHGPMFLSTLRSGDKHRRHARLSVRRIQTVMTLLSGKLDSRLHAHMLRHTFGTNAIKAGNSTLAVQKVMGHKSPTTTEQYVHLDTTDDRLTVERTYGNLEVGGFTVVTGGKEKPLELAH